MKALFELRCGDHVWKLFEDGSTEGFPPGTTVINRALASLDQLRAKEKISHGYDARAHQAAYP